MNLTVRGQELETVSHNGVECAKSTDLAEICGVARERDFIKKASQVLGNETTRNLSHREIYNDKGQTREVLYLPQRETMLMCMSYSYELQAEVYDAWKESEAILTDAVQGNVMAIEDAFIDKIADGRVKVFKRFFERLIEAKGLIEFSDSLKYCIDHVPKPKKGYVLEQFRVQFDNMVKGLSGAVAVDNINSIQKSKILIESENREFSRRSNARRIVHMNKKLASVPAVAVPVSKILVDSKPIVLGETEHFAFEENNLFIEIDFSFVKKFNNSCLTLLELDKDEDRMIAEDKVWIKPVDYNVSKSIATEDSFYEFILIPLEGDDNYSLTVTRLER